GARSVQAAAPSLHRGVDGVGAADGRARRATPLDRGTAARTAPPAGRLPLRAALSLRRSALSHRVSADGRRRRVARGRVLESAMTGLLQVDNLSKHFPVTRGLLIARTTGHV